MRMRRRALTALPLLVLVAVAQGCDEDITGPGEANLTVALTMTGNSPDPDGATVRLDGGWAIGILSGQVVELGAVVAGSHIVALDGLAPNCQVMGDNPRMVAIVSGRDLTVAFEVSCSTPVDDGTALWAYLQDVGPYEEGQPVADTTTTGTTLEERGDGAWSCTVRRVSMEQYPDDYATFNPNAEVIYPGSMLQGATLVDATPEPVVVARAGGTVVINLVNGSSGVYQHVDEVKQSTVIQAINDILAQNTQIGAARFTYSSSEVQSKEELALTLGVNVSTLSTDLSANLAFSRDREYNRFLVKLNQSFYTVSFDLPLSLSDLFGPSVTAGDLGRYVGPGNPPTYISSVTYGRTFFLLIESTASVDDMRSSIHASYNAAVVDGSLDAGATYVKDLENVNIKVFALGGDQSLAAANFNGDLNALGDFLTQGADILTGVPLSYVVRNVLDNRIVNVKVASDYDIKTCVPVVEERLYSGFDQNDEGWVSYGNGTGSVEWADECLNSGSGACIYQVDVTGGFAQFRAPVAWRDNKSWLPFYGGTIRYRMRNADGDSYGSIPGAVFIDGPAGRISTTLPDELFKAAHEDGWQGVTIDISADGTTYNLSDGGTRLIKWQRGDGQEATREEMEAVLAEVTDFKIAGEWRYGGDTTYLDEIEVLAPDSAVGSIGI